MNCEHGLEIYRFTCRHCQHTWSTEYQVRYATDCEGSQWTVYCRNGASTESPTADAIMCPSCHHTGVHAHLTARHDLPLPGQATPRARPPAEPSRLIPGDEAIPGSPTRRLLS